jgi:hypothetical protein
MEWELDTAIRGATERLLPIDDRAGGGFGALVDCHWQRRGRSRDRRTDGDRHSRRLGDFDRAEPARPADAGATVWEISEASA